MRGRLSIGIVGPDGIERAGTVEDLKRIVDALGSASPSEPADTIARESSRERATRSAYPHQDCSRRMPGRLPS